MKQLFEYHVDVKEMSPVVLERSLGIYLKSFDAQGVYCAGPEIKDLLHPSIEKMNTMMEEYNRQIYSTYFAMNELIVQSIERARGWRKEWSQHPDQLVLEAMSTDRYLEGGFTQEVALVKERHRDFFLQYIHLQGTKLPHVMKKKQYKALVALCEKQIVAHENHYLGVDEGEGKVTQKMLNHCVLLKTMKALSRSLDDHTGYYSPEEALAMKMQLEKGMQGIGVVLHEDVEGVAILDIIPQGPADKSHAIQKGDRIIEIDGIPIKDLSFSQVLDRLRGAEGSAVYLKIIREEHDTEKSHAIELKREKIVLQDKRVDVRHEPYEDGIIGVLTLHSFYENGATISSEHDLKEAIRRLWHQGNVKGLVLDMRDNAGGFLSQAIRVCSLFMKNGVVVASKYGDGKIRYYRSVGGEPAYNGPLVILVSKGSASATEIVAQCLQDYGLALVVGDDHTYGKGTIQYQTVTGERASSFFKVTVGRYYTVSGKSTQIEGVVSDIVVPSSLFYESLGERYLEYPLAQDSIPSAYQDTLEDLDPISQRWFTKHYLPELQPVSSRYAPYREQLQNNSQQRIQNNALYQEHLSAWEHHKNIEQTTDFGMEESLEILKDYLSLSKNGETQKTP